MRGRRAVLLAALLALAGCAERPPGDGPVTLVFKHARILGPADPFPGLLAVFAAAHPGVRVRSESLPWSSDEQHQFYVINLEGRSPGFDVMMLDVIWVPEFARAGWLLDLTDRVRPEELAPHFASTVAAATWAGRVWALPWNMNVGLLYYRADLLAKYGLRPPETWEELEAAVRTIRAGERDPRLEGYLWQGKQYEGMVVNVLEALWANGTRLLGADGAVFLRNWPYVLDLVEAPGSAVRGRVGLAPLPGRVRGAGAGSTGGSHLGISRGTRHPDLALALVRFLTGERAQRAMATGAALYPTRTALYRDPALVARNRWLPRIHDLMLAGRPRPVTPSYLLLSTTLQPELSAVLVGLKPPARAIADARRRLDYFLASRR